MGGGGERLVSPRPRCPLQPGSFRPELSTRGPRILAGFHRNLFPLVINVGFPDNTGGSGSNAAGVPMAMGQTWLYGTLDAVTKEISPAVSMSPWPCYSDVFVGVFLAEPFFFSKINVNCKNDHLDSQGFFLFLCFGLDFFGRGSPGNKWELLEVISRFVKHDKQFSRAKDEARARPGLGVGAGLGI